MLITTALVGKVMRSVVSVRPSVRLFLPYFLNELTFDHEFLRVYIG